MKIFVLIALAFAPSVYLFGQSALKGTVTDLSGGAIEGAVIIIHWDSSGSTVGLHSNVGIKEDVVVRTSPHGGFSVNLPPGFYDVFVSAMAFTPACQKVRIREGSAVIFDRRLQVNGLVIDEIGDKYFGTPISK